MRHEGTCRIEKQFFIEAQKFKFVILSILVSSRTGTPINPYLSTVSITYWCRIKNSLQLCTRKKID